jgi:hypothetical protein
MFSRHFNSLMFNEQQTVVIFKPLALNTIKFLPAIRAGHTLFFTLRACAFALFGGAFRAGAFALFFGP